MFERILAKQSYNFSMVKRSDHGMTTGPASGFPYFISTTGNAQTLQVNVFHCFSVRVFLHGRNGSKRIASMSPRLRTFYKIVEMRWLRFSRVRERRNFRIVF